MARKRKGRRAKGEGTLTKLPSGSWRSQITIGRDREGRLIRESVTRPTQEELIQELNRIRNEVQKGIYVKPSQMTVKGWFSEWLEGRKPYIEEKTYLGHELMIRRHILPVFGEMMLKDVTTRHIQTLLNEKMKSGLSARTIKYIFTTLNMGFKQAMKERLIQYNPADREAVELPKDRQKEKEVLDREEMALLLETAKKHSKHYTAFVLELATGLRRGELLGLHWSCIDFKRRTLAVTRQLVRSSKGLEFKDFLKTEKSRRVISLDADIIAALQAHKKRQEKWKAELRLKVGGEDAFQEIYRENDLLFCSETGKPLDPNSFVRHFKYLLRKAGLKDIPFHRLRHSFATMCLEAGIPVKTVQEMLGHATSRMLLSIYAQTTPAMHEEAARRIGGVMAGVMGTKK